MMLREAPRFLGWLCWRLWNSKLRRM